MRKIFLIVALAVSAAAQTVPSQPYEVKGVKLGSALSAWKAGVGAACMEMTATPHPDQNSFLCPGATYAGIKSQEVVTFYKSQLSSFYFRTDHDNYETLRDALKQKFGPPTSSEQKTYQNGYGASFTGEYLMWLNSTSSITLEEISGDRDHSVLLFSHTELIKAQNKAGKPEGKTSDM